MHPDDKIYIAGHNGLVGSAIQRRLLQDGYRNLITCSSAQLDLRDQQAVNQFFLETKPQVVFLAAAKVGGIWANNTYRSEFLYDNLMIQGNVIHAAYQNGVNKLLFLGSSCIYPRLAPQPIKEEYLLTGPLEMTNEPYAIAKIAGIKLCEAYKEQYGCQFISVMPTNLYGPNDSYDLTQSHVIPALIRKFHEAVKNNQSQVVIWGTGSPRREFLHVDDLARACVFLMMLDPVPGLINVGTGEDITIRKLAEMIQEISSFKGKLVFDTSKPDGTPRKQLDVSKLHQLGFRHQVQLREGIRQTYNEYDQANQRHTHTRA